MRPRSPTPSDSNSESSCATGGSSVSRSPWRAMYWAVGTNRAPGMCPASKPARVRSEERRVGKEWRAGGSGGKEKEKNDKDSQDICVGDSGTTEGGGHICGGHWK